MHGHIVSSAAERWKSTLLVTTMLASVAADGVCQSYPMKAVRIITGSVGSNVDVSSRLVASELTRPLGQQVIVDNRAGAVIAGDLVSKAAPDGYTVLVTGGSLWVGPLLRDNTPYDAVRDFSPIAILGKAPAVLVVHPSLPVKTVAELVALAKARPGALNYSSGGAGGAAHLSTELFKAMTGTNLVGIFYKSDAMQVADLLGGRTQLTFGNPSGMAPLVLARKLRALAVTSLRPSALFPGLPTVAASGVPDYESVGVAAMFVPARTAQAIVARLSEEIAKVLGATDIRERLLRTGVEAVGSTPEELAAFMRTETARMSKVIKEAGIRAE